LRWLWRVLGVLSFSLVVFLGLSLGAFGWSSPAEVGRALLSLIGLGPAKLGFVEQTIVSIRLPRLVLGLMVGASLAISGATLQALFRNPLADPGLIGVSSGAALGAVSWIVMGSVFSLLLPWDWLDSLGLPVMAFVGAMIMAVTVFRLASSSGRVSVVTLLLAGIACNAIAGAVIGLFTYLADDAQLRTLTFWSMGSLAAGGWAVTWLPLVSMFVGVALLLRSGRMLNAMLLGEDDAAFLGHDVEKIKRRSIWLTAWVVANAVCLTGGIGFVGLVVPHLCRLAVGPDHRRLLPLATVCGAILLVVADVIARTIVAPSELPIGILTACLGGPIFLAMLLKQRRRWSL
jgi:iron complex transport system permease protein